MYFGTHTGISVNMDEACERSIYSKKMKGNIQAFLGGSMEPATHHRNKASHTISFCFPVRINGLPYIVVH